MNRLTGMGARAQMIGLGAASLALVAMAFGFEAAGFRPCELCILQRWPHAIAGAIGLIALVMARPPRALAVLGLGVMLVSLGLGIYHSGVEWHLWAGPSACTGGGNLTQMSTRDLLDQIMAAPMVRCDQPALTIFGTTMANWNAVASGLLAALWARAAVAR
ncbi:disulfide bond formation protein B [Paracoccus sp. p4-l81]|uniref:disulfide bond formation protein B n=1 Tax=unclassified Paracoccus (in: a-proteobacteria) TaxID=2688777 RepID=UPI0035B885D8